jgi:RHS repeat-associated protein
LATNNGSAAIYPSVTNQAVLSGATNITIGSVFLPKTPEVFSYDVDGNLTNDGRWGFTWDGENRLIAMAGPTTAPSGSCKSLAFAYDYRGRRISKVVSNWTGSAWSKVSEQHFLYDGWNLIADLDANNTLLHSYSWGTDLSGSMQGAGGVGGLIGMTVQSGTNAGSYFVAYDGNGNVAALANAADGTIAARYEYSPFGELIRSSGSAAASNPCRFSTKFTDDETDLVSYGYRCYNPSTGRWINRDPIGDEGFFEAYAARRSWSEQLELRSEGLQPVYAIDGNNPIDRFDAFGLLRFDSKCKPSDIERMKKDLKDRCETAKKSDCFRCLKQKGRDALSKMCDEIDKNTGPKVVCEDSSNKDCAQNNWCAWTGALGGIHVCVGKMNDPTISCSMPGCSLLHEGGHSVGGVGDDTKPTGDNRSYAIEKCVGCAVPDGRKLPPGY